MADVIVTTREDLQQMISEAVNTAMQKFKPTAPRETKYLTVAEVAKKLKVAPLTVYRQIKAGKIPSKQVGALIKIPSNYLDS